MQLTIDTKTALALTKALIAFQTEQKSRKATLSEQEKEDIRLIDEHVLRSLWREARLQTAHSPQEYIQALFS